MTHLDSPNTPDASPLSNADRELILRAISNTQRAKSFHFTLVTTGYPTDLEGDYVAPDRIRVTGTINGQAVEHIIIAEAIHPKEITLASLLPITTDSLSDLLGRMTATQISLERLPRQSQLYERCLLFTSRRRGYQRGAMQSFRRQTQLQDTNAWQCHLAIIRRSPDERTCRCLD